MARRQEQLVETIRAQRRSLGRDLSALLALQPMRVWIRQHPLPWVAGGSVSGFLAARLLVRPTWRQRQAFARGWIRSRMRDTFLNLVLLGLREGARNAVSTRQAATSGVQAPRSAASSARQSSPGRSEPPRDAPSPTLDRVS